MKNMDVPQSSIGFKIKGDICLVDCATTHTILKDKKYFSSLVMEESNVNTICGSTKLIERYGKTNLLLSGGTKLAINESLFCSKSQRNLLSFKDIRQNGYHIETTTDGKKECLCITAIVRSKKCILEKLPSFSSGLYYTNISMVETHAIVNQKFTNPDTFIIWHDRLGHPGSIMMRRIIENSNGHPLKNQKILMSNEFFCAASS